MQWGAKTAFIRRWAESFRLLEERGVREKVAGEATLRAGRLQRRRRWAGGWAVPGGVGVSKRGEGDGEVVVLSP